MKLKVEKTDSYKWAIIVDEKDLRRLDETIKSIMNSFNDTNIKLEYKIKCSDGSKIETGDINEVVAEENSKSRSIENIEIVANDQNFTNTIDISLGSRGYFQTAPIFYSITGDSRDWVYLTTSKIEERIKSLRQWYSFFMKLNLGWLIYFVVAFFLIFISVQPKKEVSGDISLTEFLKGFSILVAIFVIIYLVYKLINYGRDYLFPPTVFRIGEGIRRHNTIIDLRAKIFWGIFVGLIIGIISGVILIKIA